MTILGGSDGGTSGRISGGSATHWEVLWGWFMVIPGTPYMIASDRTLREIAQLRPKMILVALDDERISDDQFAVIRHHGWDLALRNEAKRQRWA